MREPILPPPPPTPTSSPSISDLFPDHSTPPCIYAGIGSRATPPSELQLMTDLGRVLARCGIVLRSGGAPGADTAFEKGCDQAKGRKQIFLPWKGFNRNPSPLYAPPHAAFEMAGAVHSRWDLCKPASRKFHARNCQQILGERLDHPVNFVLFWSPVKNDGIKGGTTTAIRLAQRERIPTYNLWLPEMREPWARLVNSWKREDERNPLAQ